MSSTHDSLLLGTPPVRASNGILHSSAATVTAFQFFALLILNEIHSRFGSPPQALADTSTFLRTVDEIVLRIHQRAVENGYAMALLSRLERDVLELIREGGVESVEVLLRQGAIGQVIAHRSAGDVELADVLRMLADHEFQTVTVTKHDGRFTKVRQRIVQTIRKRPIALRGKLDCHRNRSKTT